VNHPPWPHTLRKSALRFSWRENSDNRNAERRGDVEWPRVVTDEPGGKRDRRGGYRQRAVIDAIGSNAIDVVARRMRDGFSKLVQLGRRSDPQRAKSARLQGEGDLRPLGEGDTAIAHAGERVQRDKTVRQLSATSSRTVPRRDASRR